MDSRKDSIDNIRNNHGFPFPSDPPMTQRFSGMGDGRQTPRSVFFPGSGTQTPRTPGSIRASTSAFHLHATSTQKYFRSRRIKDVSTIEKPWVGAKDPSRKWHTIFPLLGLFIGLGLVGLFVYDGWTSVVNHDYCSVYSVDFTTGGQLDPKIWTKEVQLGGFGNGDFAVTTDTEENVFVKNGELWIKPTLQDPNLINKNSVLDLTKQGICTSKLWSNCHAVTNTTNGTIVNPVRSGRINTRKGASIQYGRVEVEAALPEGDWMWPAIWLLPTDDVYGSWPASGEIDIAESRGNNHTYPLGGNDQISSTLHWGPSPVNDAWYRTFIKRGALHTTFTKKFHTFGLEWSEKYLFTYVNARLQQALYVPFTKPLWPQGHFDPSNQNGTSMVDPWSQTGRPSTPFDQKFYLILNVAVGSTNAWWQDGMASKPWVDASPTAKKDFWDSQNQWYPTWKENGQMRIKSVKMWQQGGYQGCAGK